MCDSSDVEVVDDLDKAFVQTIEEFDSYYNSSEDEDPTVSGLKAIKLAKSELERDRRSHLTNLFDYLQQVVLNGEQKESWKRIKTVQKALEVCNSLCLEEKKLLFELELLTQENWKLKKRIAKISKKRERKSVSSTLTRRISSLSLTPPQITTLEKRRMSMDDSKLKPLTLPPMSSESSLDQVDNKLTESKSPKPVRRPRRKSKKRTGLSEDEKEFYSLKEKIEDLLFEVDSLWNEVKDDEEFDDVVKNIKSEPIDTPQEDLSPQIAEFTSDPKSGSNKLKIKEEVPKVITVTDINKLIQPKFLEKKCNIASKSGMPFFGSTQNDSSDDESRLVIDEGDMSKTSDQEVDVLEALKAVDTLCQKVIGEEPSTSESDRNIESTSNTTVRRRSTRAKFSRYSDGLRSTFGVTDK